MIYGYIRVSTHKQSYDAMEREIAEYAKTHNFKIDKWIEETISSRKALKNRKLGILLEQLKNNDILIATEISRLGRSLLEVMAILQTCLSKNCQVITIKENYHLGNDIQSQVLAFAFGLSAQIERNLISQRTKSSLENLKAKGKKLGRPYGAETKKLKLSKNIKKIRQLLNEGTSKNQIARIIGVQRITLHRFLCRMQWFNEKTSALNKKK
ncbi:MAG: recombinase family protein [Alphaproteobacteria bacterium]|nr:recombinase family protein [Alphaproteobacteria bacterium]